MTNLSDPPEDHQPAAEIRIFHHRQKITDADRHVLYGRAGGQDDFVGDAPPYRQRKIDCIIDTEYIEEIIKDGRCSPFKTTGSTQRPDVAAAKLMEGASS